MLPLGLGQVHAPCRFIRAIKELDSGPEQLALTDQLFDTAFGELSAVARGQPCLLFGNFNVEPIKIPCLAKGISAGLWVDFEKAWALAAGLQPTPLVSGGILLEDIVGTLWLVAHSLLLLFFLARLKLIGGLLLILRFGLSLTAAGGLVVYSACAAHSSLAGLLVACC